MKKETISKKIGFILSILILLSAVMSLFANLINAAALDRPLLYYNDKTWVREDRYPIKIIDGEHYIPLTVFAQLDDTKVRVNNTLNTFVISHAGLYVSFDATTHTATDQSENTYYITTYKFEGGERYVPAKTVCKYLGFGFDSYTSVLTGEVAIRVTDGTEKLSFKKLLERYNPDHIKTEEDTGESTSVTVTETESTAETTETVTVTESTTADLPKPPARVLGNRIIYLTFSDGINGNTDKILDTLAAYGYNATFFIDCDDIVNAPMTVARMIADGHKIGITPTGDVYTDFDTFALELERTNELLFRVFKITTRTVRPESRYRDNKELYNSLHSEDLESLGYALWNANVPRADGVYDIYTATDMMIEAIWQSNTAVFDFGNNDSTNYVLGRTLDFIVENAQKCDTRVADSCFTPQR